MAVATASSPSPLTGPSSWVPSQLTHLRVQHRAARLARVFGLDRNGRDDVRQQLWLRAVQAAGRFEPGRGATLDHFIRLHLDYEYRNLRAELMAERGLGVVPEAGPGPAWPSRWPDHRPSSDLRLDLEAAENRLPPDLRAVAFGLRSLTPAQIAAERGVHRGTVYREIALLRAIIADFLAEDETPRDNSGPGAERYGRGASAAQPIDPGATTAVRGRGGSAHTPTSNGGHRRA